MSKRPSRLLVDSHLDLAWNAVQWGRDLTRPVHTIRTQEAALPGKGRGEGTVALPELANAGIGIAFVTTLARCTGISIANLDYGHPSQAFAAARGHMAYYLALERCGYGRILRSRRDVSDHLSSWQRWHEDTQDTIPYPGLGMAMCMESGDPILNAQELPEWKALGIWLIGPAHYGHGRYAGGTGSDIGMTDDGRDLLQAMSHLGISLDVTHLSDRAFDQALDLFDGIVLASHSNCRHLVSHQRQMTDTQIRAMIKREGVIGVALDVWMLAERWVKGHSTNEGIDLGSVVDHIDYICQLSGSTRHVAIGTDLDGGFGKSQSPADIETIEDVVTMADLLQRGGYRDEHINAIFNANWLRILNGGLANMEARPDTLDDASTIRGK